MANGNSIPLELEPFAAAVARLSNNTVRIEFKNDWRQGSPSYETGVIGDVKAGKADLGWAGSRAFDSVGVPTFDALHAPLLIDSYALEQRVLQSPLVGDMLDGLKPLGVIGLGVLPGPMRKPLGVSPLVRPEDYRGKTIAISRSRVARQTLRALGASAKEIPAGGEIDAFDGVEQQISAIEGNDYDNGRQEPDRERQPLAAAPGPVHEQEGVRRAQRHPARRAPRGSAQRAAGHDGDPAQGARGTETAILCRRKPTFLTASDSDLAALRRAVRPVYDRLERDTVTKSAIEQIRTMRSGAALDHRRAEVLQRDVDDESCGQGHANRRGVPHDDDAAGVREVLRRGPRRRSLRELRSLEVRAGSGAALLHAVQRGHKPLDEGRLHGEGPYDDLAGHRLRWRGSQRRVGEDR